MATHPESFPLSYCAGGWETIDRLDNLFERRDAGQLCAVFNWRTRALDDFARKHPAGFCEYPDPAERIRFWDAHLKEHAQAQDDYVPSVYLSEFDQGLYGGLFGGEVRFLSDTSMGWISSMVPPLVKSISEAKGLRLDRGHPWFRRYVKQMDVFAREAKGKFGIGHFILIDGLNFVFELVGATDTYLALVDYPDEVSHAIDFAYELNVAVHEAYFEHVGLVAGGTPSIMTGWTRGRIVNESVDPFHMTSVGDFEKWGREPIERIFKHFDGGVLHVHANGRHLLEAVRDLPGLKGISVPDDKDLPRSFEVLGELQAKVKGVPLVVGVAYAEFVRALDRNEILPGALYLVNGTPGPDEANRTMEKVRKYRA